MEQVVIAGTGPAGLTASIYAARARLDPQVIEGITPGGQLIVSHEVENMPGFPEGISGLDLIELFKRQAERFGARFQSGVIRSVAKQGSAYILTTDEAPVETRTVDCGGIFVAIGHDPQTEAFRDLVVCDEHGFIQVESGSTQTSAPGVFACGDVCDPVYKQAVVAAGLGCMAALDAQRYLEQQDT